MTHDELLAKITELQPFRYLLTKEDSIAFGNALRAVVELHKPVNNLCDGCYEEESGPSDYPCPTIQAIEEQLNANV